MADAVLEFLRRDDAPDQLRQVAPAADALTRQAIVNATELLARNAGQPPISEEGLRMGLRPGVPMEVNQGSSSGVRFQLGLDADPINQFKYLAGQYGLENVEVAPNGQFIIRNQIDPNTGIKQDVMVNPPGMDSGDWAEFGSQTLPIAAGVVAARAGMKVPGGGIAKTLYGVGFGAGAQRMLQGEQEAVTRLFRGDPINLPSITQQRAKDAAADAVFGLALAGAGATLRAISPLSQVTPEVEAANAARDRLNAILQNKLPQTPGLKTGSPFLLRSEAQARQIPGSAGVFDAMVIEEQAAVDELRRIALGVPRTMDDATLRASLPQSDVVGQQALGKLGNVALKAEGAVETAKQAVSRTGTIEAQKVGQAMLGAPVNTTLVGRDIASKTKAAWAEFNAYWGNRYEQFFSRPETTDLVVDATGLGKLAQKLRKEFIPLAKTTKSVPSGLLNASGQPMMVNKVSVEELDRFVQSKVLSALDELGQLKGAQTSIRSLKQIRTNIDDAIAANVAIPGTDTGQLKKLRGEISGFITQALKAKDPELLKEWEALNKGWATGMSKFDWNNIRDILIKPGQPGYPGETVIAERVLGTSGQAKDAWEAYKQFFGTTSSEMKSLHQAIRSKVISGAEDTATQSISGSTLKRNIENLRPEIADEVFGLNKSKLSEIADALATAQGKYDIGELMQLANSRTLTAKALMDLGVAETNRAKTYSNALIKAAMKGAIGAETIQPSEFVRYMTNAKLKLDPVDIRLVKSIINEDPALARQVEQLAVEDLFEKAGLARKAKVRFSDDIENALGDETQRRRWEALVGKDTLKNVQDLADSLRPGGLASGAFQSAGSLSGGVTTARITSGELHGLPEIGKRLLIAKIYSNPATRNLIANNLMDGPTTLRVINAMVTSQPFATEVLRRFGPEAGINVMQGFKDMLDKEYAGEENIAIEEFLRRNP